MEVEPATRTVRRGGETVALTPMEFDLLVALLRRKGAIVQRVRVSRAALRLRAPPRASATRVALDCGFSSLSAFSRAFKQVFGVRLRDWNRDDPLQNRKICQAALALRRYTPAELEGVDAQREFRVSLRPFPPTRIAYIRIANAYSDGNVLSGYFRLRRWADAVIGPGPYRTIGMSGDDPDITPLELCRYDIAIAVPGHVTGDGDDRWPPAGPNPPQRETASTRPLILPARVVSAVCSQAVGRSARSPTAGPL